MKSYIAYRKLRRRTIIIKESITVMMILLLIERGVLHLKDQGGRITHQMMMILLLILLKRAAFLVFAHSPKSWAQASTPYRSKNTGPLWPVGGPASTLPLPFRIVLVCLRLVVWHKRPFFVQSLLASFSEGIDSKSSSLLCGCVLKWMLQHFEQLDEHSISSIVYFWQSCTDFSKGPVRLLITDSEIPIYTVK